MCQRSVPLFLGLLLVSTPGSASAAQAVKLNGPLQKSSDLDSFLSVVSPDGRWLVYQQEQPLPVPLAQIHSVPLDGSGPPVVLSLPEFRTWSPFEVTADSQRVVYRTSDATGWALVSSPIGAGALPTVLKLGYLVHDFRLSPAGSRVVVVAEVTPGVRELFSVPVDRSSPPVKLNPVLVAGGNVDATGFVISPDGRWVAYRADQDVDGVTELYGVPIDASQPARKLHGPMTDPGGFALPELAIGAANHVVFLTYIPPSSLVTEARSVPVDGSQPAVRLSPSGLEHVGGLSLSPDGTEVLFTAGETPYESHELYKVPVQGGLATSLSGPLVAGGNVYHVLGGRPAFAVDPSTSLVVYLADQIVDRQTELFSVPLDGSRAPRRLNQPLSSFGGIELFLLSSTGRVVYWTDDLPATPIDSVPTDGSAPPVRLSAGWHPPDFPFDRDGLAVSPDGQWVVFSSPEAPHDLYSVPTDGSAPPRRLTTFIEDRGVFEADFALAGDWAVYSADTAYPRAFEIHTVLVDGSAPSVRRSADLPLITVGDVIGFEVDPDGKHVTYMADEVDSCGLHLTTTDGRVPPRRIVTGRVYEWIDDAARDRTLYVPWVSGDRNIYSVSDAGGSPLRLNGPAPGRPLKDLGLVPDGTRVLYESDGDLWSVGTTGSADDVRLIPGPVEKYHVQGQRVLADAGSLVSRLVTGGAPGVDLGLHDGAFVLFTPDGTRVLFSTPVGMSIAPIDGSSTTLALEMRGQVFAPLLGADATSVIYVDDFEVLDRNELYAQPIDGSGSPRRIGPSMPRRGDVRSLTLDADRSQAFYVADGEVNEVFELYGVPTSGGPSLKLSGPMPSGGDVTSVFSVGPRVVYLADQEQDGVVELFSVPADGSAAPTKLSPALVTGGDVQKVLPAPNGSFVVFAADAEVDEHKFLYVAPIDGRRPAQRLHRLPVPEGLVATDSLQLLVDPPPIVFAAVLDEPGVLELYSSPIQLKTQPK